jgi:hypothetical protein
VAHRTPRGKRADEAEINLIQRQQSFAETDFLKKNV